MIQKGIFQVVNAMKDLKQGKLSRIWVRRPLQQLATALNDSILRLPPCRLRQEYLQGATLAIHAIVDHGELPTNPVCCGCILVRP
jgi:hypothetical protein